MLIDAEYGDLQQGHDEKLDRAGFPQNRSKRDQNRCCTEVSIDHSVEELWDRCRVLLIGICSQISISSLIKLNVTLTFLLNNTTMSSYIKSVTQDPTVTKRMSLPINADSYFSIMQVPDVLEKKTPLQAKGSQQQVDAHTAEAISL